MVNATELRVFVEEMFLSLISRLTVRKRATVQRKLLIIGHLIWTYLRSTGSSSVMLVCVPGVFGLAEVIAL